MPNTCGRGFRRWRWVPATRTLSLGAAGALALSGRLGAADLSTAARNVLGDPGPLLWALVPWGLWLLYSALWGAIALLAVSKPRRLRAMLSGICLLGCILSLWPPYPWGAHSGGVRLTLQVAADDALRDLRDTEMGMARDELARRGVGFSSIAPTGALSFAVEGVEPARVADVRALLNERLRRDWTIVEGPDGRFKLQPAEATTEQVRQRTFTEAARVLERRVGALGLLGSVTRGAGAAQIEIELLGVRDVDSAKRVIQTTARLSLQLVEDSGASREALLQRVDQNVAATMEVLPGAGPESGGPTYYLVRKEAAISGRDLKNARATIGAQNQPSVAFTLNPTGADKFRHFTGRNIGRQLAIVLDGSVQSAPRIESAIGADGQINGRFTAQEAQELATVLRAGALPASVRVLQEASVPPTSITAPVMRAAVVSAICLLVAALGVFVGYRLSGAAAAVAFFSAGAIVILAASVVVQRTLAVSAASTLILLAGLPVERMARGAPAS